MFGLIISSESKHVGLLFQLVGQLKQFVPNLPVSAAHKTLTFCLKQEDFPVSSDHKKRPQHMADSCFVASKFGASEDNVQ